MVCVRLCLGCDHLETCDRGAVRHALKAGEQWRSSWRCGMCTGRTADDQTRWAPADFEIEKAAWLAGKAPDDNSMTKKVQQGRLPAALRTQAAAAAAAPVRRRRVEAAAAASTATSGTAHSNAAPPVCDGRQMLALALEANKTLAAELAALRGRVDEDAAAERVISDHMSAALAQRTHRAHHPDQISSEHHEQKYCTK